MPKMTNEEFQNIVRIGDMISFTGVSKDYNKFIGYKKCDNSNVLCKTCNGHILYVNSNGSTKDRCCRMTSGGLAMINVSIKGVFLQDEEMLL